VRRLRFFRVVLPALLLPFLVLLVFQLRPKPAVHNPARGDEPAGPRVSGMDYVEFAGGQRVYSGTIGLVRQQPDGRVDMERIERFVIERDDAPPLVVSAERGGIDGKPGEREVRLRGGVEAREQGEGLSMELPELEVDQAAGEARSVGAVRLASPAYAGSAESVVYGLEGQPTVLFGVRLEARDGGTLVAQRVRLLDGTDDVELEGEVRLQRGSEFLAAETMRVWRWPDGGGVSKVVARSGVSGRLSAGGGGPAELRSEEMEAEWDEQGREKRLLLVGDARVGQAGRSIQASWIEVARAEGLEGGFGFAASGAVVARGGIGGEPVEVRSQELSGTLGSDRLLRSAEAAGTVEYISPATRAEAERAVFELAEPLNRVTLESGPRRRARLARDNMRVVADRIVTDSVGLALSADGRVEASLLPQAAGAGGTGLFRSDEAVHFVASRLDGTRSGSRLHFSGAVRGWQGDRTLSADSVLVDQLEGLLTAEGEVGTRLPRREDRAALAQADFVQISADRLDYREQDARAVYDGKARVRQAEGWMESARLEVLLSREREGIEEIRGFESVRLEYRAPGEQGTPHPVSGEGDRVVYTVANQTLRLYGDDNPATAVRRTPQGADSTSGRVLRYRLDVGTLTVESGDQDRVRIRTSGRAS